MPDVYRRCASIVVFRSVAEGIFEILLLKKPRKRDAWQLPQGGIEGQETLRDAALRELHEEAGIDAEVIGESLIQYQYEYPSSFRRFRPDNVRGQQIGFIFAQVSPDVSIRVDQKEIMAFRWTSVQDIPRFIKRKEYLDIIRSLLREGERLLESRKGVRGQERQEGFLLP